ncbi:rRNA-processing protein EFG1 [Scheffersomyces coipomensis]|uniref:rRNA-processing protein EFG1 n=1 Tax=Scheffersomyces coipomensis TaxID=1788519 RepID=UPI00315D6111
MANTAPKNNRRSNGASIEVSKVLGAGSSKIKKKIRDIERLLKKDNLPANVRVENERSLKALKVELGNTKLNLKAKEISKKYHMVRFFEKKKAVRKAKQARKEFEEVSKAGVRKEIKKARKKLRHSEVDLAYIVLFPKTEKYISLYPNPKENDEVDMKNPKAKKGIQLTEQRKRELINQAEKLIEEDKLPFSLEDVIQGKTIKLDERSHNEVPTEEIDAPVQKEEEEEDDFFE